MKTTMNSKEGTMMTKYLSQEKLVIKKREKIEDKVTFLFFLALNMFI